MVYDVWRVLDVDRRVRVEIHVINLYLGSHCKHFTFTPTMSVVQPSAPLPQSAQDAKRRAEAEPEGSRRP